MQWEEVELVTQTPVKLQIFMDYTCPWVRQAGNWLARVKEQMGSDLEITWRCFALEQVNSKEGPDWKAWEQGDDYVSRGLWAHRGGIAARSIGEAAHAAYMSTFMEAKHVEREDLRSRESIVDIAEKAGLDMDKFLPVFDDPATLAQIGKDHEEAVEMGVFGTPTFVFEDGSAAFLKTYTPPEEDTMDAFEHLLGVARGHKYFGELKRPQPPWPRGATD
jgi:predicted DsbA family dithiol-disulfide isomerase